MTIMIKLQHVCVSCCLHISYTTQRNAMQRNATQHNTTQPLKSLSQVLGGFFCISKSKNDAKACIILFEGLVRPQTDEISHSVDFVSSSEGLDVCVPGKSGVCLYIGRAEGGRGVHRCKQTH